VGGDGGDLIKKPLAKGTATKGRGQEGRRTFGLREKKEGENPGDVSRKKKSLKDVNEKRRRVRQLGGGVFGGGGGVLLVFWGVFFGVGWGGGGGVLVDTKNPEISHADKKSSRSPIQKNKHPPEGPALRNGIS